MATAGGAGTKKRIVVVEDDESIRSMVAVALRAKYEVHEAADGLAASELLFRIPPPDVVICDVMMPKVDGFTLLRSLRKVDAFKHTRFIVLSAKHSPQDIVQGIQLGVKHYLQKPFQVADLLAKIDKLFG